MATSSARRPRSGSSAHSSAPDRNSVALHSNLRRARLATRCELDRRRCSNDDIPHDHLRDGYDAVRLPPVALIRSPARCPHSALSSAFAIPWRRYMGRGAIIVSFIVCYALTSVVGGYVSGSLTVQPRGNVIHTMILTASLFPGVLVITMVLNFVAFMYRSRGGPILLGRRRAAHLGVHRLPALRCGHNPRPQLVRQRGAPVPH